MIVERDDVFVFTEVNMLLANGKSCSTSPGSETMACRIMRVCGNPGDPLFSCFEVSMPDN